MPLTDSPTARQALVLSPEVQVDTFCPCWVSIHTDIYWKRTRLRCREWKINGTFLSSDLERAKQKSLLNSTRSRVDLHRFFIWLPAVIAPPWTLTARWTGGPGPAEFTVNWLLTELNSYLVSVAGNTRTLPADKTWQHILSTPLQD